MTEMGSDATDVSTKVESGGTAALPDVTERQHW
jgi:hypothetical protein